MLKWIYRKIYFWTVRRKNDKDYAIMGKEMDIMENTEEVHL